MKISFTSNYSFKSNYDINRIGFDDEISQARREYIREHLARTMPPEFPTGRLDEWELDALLKSLLGKNYKNRKTESKPTNPILITSTNNEVNDEIMLSLQMDNIMPIKRSNSYRGGLPHGYVNPFLKLKEAGIQRIAAFEYYPDTEELCKKAGLEFFYFPIDSRFSEIEAFKTEDEIIQRSLHYSRDIMGYNDTDTEEYKKLDIRYWKAETREFIDEFVKYIQFMQKDYVYAGCLFGTDRTNIGLMLNHYFNPKAFRTPSCVTLYNKYLVPKLKTLLDNMSMEDLRKIGWNEEIKSMQIKRFV